ncbi:MAG: nitroreductase family protein [Bacteroidales bacterium]|nr:nitroreductase family protein [Bacteroidales bacterium]
MRTFSEIMQSRRSMRKFTEEKLTDDEVNSLLKVALMSPSSKRSNCWQFVAVDDKETLQRLSLLKQQSAAFIADAALAVAVLADESLSDVWQEDTAIATICMQLQAEDMGLGSCWVQVRNRMYDSTQTSEEYVRTVLGIPSHLRVLCVLAIGHKGMERKPFNEEFLQWEKLHHNKY